MNNATLAQGNQVLNLILQKKLSTRALQLFLESDLLSILLETDPTKISRKAFLEALGFKLTVVITHEGRCKTCDTHQPLYKRTDVSSFADTKHSFVAEHQQNGRKCQGEFTRPNSFRRLYKGDNYS